MKIRSHHLAASLLAGAMFLGTLAWFGAQAPTALATCTPGTTVTLGYPNGTTTPSLTGVQTLHAFQSTTSTMQPSGMTFMIVTPAMVLGQGVLASTGTDWSLSWDSRNVPNGTYQMQAIARYGTNTTYDCPSPLSPFSINNAPTQSPSLSAGINPSTWQGIPGQSSSFNVNAIYTDQFGRQSPLPSGSSINWATSAGQLSNPNSPSTILTAGPAAGTFPLTVTVGSNGLVAHAVSSIKVYLSTTSTSGGTTTSPSPSPVTGTSPSPTPASSTTVSATGSTATVTDPDLTTPLSSADTLRLTTEPTIFRPADPSNSKPIVAIRTLGCLERKIGENRFGEISTGKSQPTSDERHKATTCFTGSDKIPGLLAPVEPSRDKISDLTAETGVVDINGLKNQTTANAKGDKVESILVSGTGIPNSSVFIYIFSDPMVLRAETDGQGKWNYVLQNPLAPGHHEVYAVAEKDSSTFVRSSVIPVSIAAASQGSTEGSLVIEQTWQPAQIAFAGGAALMVIAAIFLLFRLKRRHPAVPVTEALIMPAPIAPTVAPVVVSPSAPTPPIDETKT